MGLSYHFSFRAPGSTPHGALADFLHTIEGDAKLMGFSPTIVIDGPFDNAQRREFAKRVARPLTVEDCRLKGAVLPAELYWWFSSEAGVCRLAPEYGVLLVITNERREEIVFGFLRYPRSISDRNGNLIMTVEPAQDWLFGSFVDSADPRYRSVVRRFNDAGYLAREHDEFLPRSG